MKSNETSRHNTNQYACMQQRGVQTNNNVRGRFSQRVFIIKLLIGLIGAIGIWYFDISANIGENGSGIDPIRLVPLIICVILLIVGILAVVDRIKRLLA